MGSSASLGFCPSGTPAGNGAPALSGEPGGSWASHPAWHFPVLQVRFVFPPWFVCFGKEPRRKKTHGSWAGLTPGPSPGHCLGVLQTENEGFAPEAPDGLLSSPVPRALAIPGSRFRLCPLAMTSLMGETVASRQGASSLLGVSAGQGRGLLGKPQPDGETGLSREAVVCPCPFLESVSIALLARSQLEPDTVGKGGGG